MSIGHRLEEDEIEEATLPQLYVTLGTGDTADLIDMGYTLDTDHDIPCGGGNSVDRKVIFIDHELYEEVMDGEFNETDLTPDQIIRLWIGHEHDEVCISHGSNDVNRYYPCHKRALCKEHLGVDLILGPGHRKNYERVIWPGLARCYNRDPKKPPKQLWVEPHLDGPTDRDNEIILQLQKLGVTDAFKYGKGEAEYGWAIHSCDTCRFFDDKVRQLGGQLQLCDRVSGLARDVLGCRHWMKLRAPPA